MSLFDDRYEKIDLIGNGAFSEVWQAIDTQTGVTLALKIFMAGGNMDEEGRRMLTREFALMIDADHCNLLRPLYFGISQDKEHLPYLILPYCKNGNIYKKLGKMQEREAWKLIRDTASALAYLHAMNPPIIHQDIKPANILMGNDGYYKLSDFGVSIRAKSTLSSIAEADRIYNSAGTISYMAPEKFSSDTRPIMANDIWSLGAMVYEMLSGQLPFGNDGGLIQKKGADIPILHGDFSHLLKQTLVNCMQEEPWKRPMASDLEEIAIDALSKAPTVIITEEPPIYNTLQDTEQDEPQQLSNRSKKPAIWATTIILLAVIGAAVYFLTRPTPTETIPEAKPAPTKKTIIEEVKTGTQETTPTPPTETPQTKPVEPVKNERVSPVEKDATPQHPSTSSSGKLDLGYAVWEGKSTDGKPNGFGTMTFRESHRIESRDPQGNIAQNGDKIEGNYINGHLEYGTWIKSNGEREELFIGQ